MRLSRFRPIPLWTLITHHLLRGLKSIVTNSNNNTYKISYNYKLKPWPKKFKIKVTLQILTSKTKLSPYSTLVRKALLSKIQTRHFYSNNSKINPSTLTNTPDRFLCSSKFNNNKVNSGFPPCSRKKFNNLHSSFHHSWSRQRSKFRPYKKTAQTPPRTTKYSSNYNT
jgi:hypothetical protein